MEQLGVSPRWGFPHATRGTCVVGCHSYGYCHCGCGGRPKRSGVTHASGDRYRDRPFLFVPGHQLRVVHPRAGIWSKNGVPVEKVRPLVLWLRERHGSIRAVAELLGMPESTLRGYVYNRKRKRVPPASAQRIAALVLAHRQPASPLDGWEEEPGPVNTSRSTSLSVLPKIRYRPIGVRDARPIGRQRPAADTSADEPRR